MSTPFVQGQLPWMKLLQGMGSTNPWLAALSQGLPMFGDAIGSLSDTQADKQNRWSFGQRKDLYNMLRWNMYGKSGDVLPQGQQQQMLANYRAFMKPQMGNMLWGASRNAGLDSKQTWNMFMQNWLPLQAGFANQLGMQNVSMTQNRNRAWEQLMASLVGG